MSKFRATANDEILADGRVVIRYRPTRTLRFSVRLDNREIAAFCVYGRAKEYAMRLIETEIGEPA